MKKLLALILLFTTTGCATILSGRTQNITIESNPPGARCELTREGRIIGAVDPTPGAMMVNKTKHDISVRCTKSGYQDASGYLKSGTEGATFGNILAGGVIGWGIDSAAGADNKYPDVTTISLVPAGAVAPVAAPLPTPKGAVIPVAAQSPTKPKPSTTLEARLRNLDDLREKKLLTEEDYQRAREKILSEL